ncbi:MAG: hypothetical protein DRN66_00125 [Candidatus Nanohalarchaeota archaeon]|nr:MAG: hypothetical protein DRN66_00125 [Candidatus Nanohaloarchaeota archaeon]
MLNMADLKDQIINFTYNIYGKYIEEYVSKNKDFDELKNNIKISGINLTLTEFLCLTLLATALCFVFTTPLASIVIYLITENLFFALFLSVFVSFFFSLMMMFGILYIPYFIKGDRNKKIDDILPFALSYLSVMAGAHNPSVSIFKTIAQFNEYGEVSIEAKKIVEEVELMGINFNDALIHAAERTPSKTFKNVLWGIKSTIESGGNLKQFLREDTAEAMNSYKIRLSKYEDQVMLLTEIYLTAVVVGSIFIIVLSVIFSVIGGLNNDMIITMQLVVVILVLPFSAVGFLMLERGMAPAQV